MLTDTEYQGLTMEAEELERIVAAIKQWPWMEKRWPRVPRPEALPAEMQELLGRGSQLVELIMNRLGLSLVWTLPSEGYLIAYAAKVLAVLKLAGVVPYRQGYSILPRRPQAPRPLDPQPRLRLVK
jgi:hypothetical protein